MQKALDCCQTQLNCEQTDRKHLIFTSVACVYIQCKCPTLNLLASENLFTSEQVFMNEAKYLP